MASGAKAVDDSLLPWLNGPSADFLADPYPAYHRLRADDPVHRSPDGEWYVSRFADVAKLLTDPRLCRQSPGGACPFTLEQRERTVLDRMVSSWMVFMDPPGHTRLRETVGRCFRPDKIKAMRPHIEQIVEHLLDSVRDAGSMEVVGDLAYPLPVIVVSEMLGAPVEDRELFHETSRRLTEGMDRGTEEDMATAVPAAVELTDYFCALVAERRKRPRDDMISTLIAAQAEDGGASDEEIVANCVFMIWAGHETTKNLISGGLLSLLRWPEQLEALRRNPALIKSAVEELLRFESPVQKMCRWAADDLEIGGKAIARHELVVAIVAAANRDPERFKDPDRLEIARPDAGHIAFGRGPHLCLGTLLARIEVQSAIAAVLRRMRRLSLQGEELAWQPTTCIRGLSALPLSFENA